MKRKLIACLLALLLCLSLCACGAAMNRGNTSADRSGGTNRTDVTNGTGGADGTDMVHDKNDGIVRDGNADDGIVDSVLPTASPRETRHP